MVTYIKRTYQLIGYNNIVQYVYTLIWMTGHLDTLLIILQYKSL